MTPRDGQHRLLAQGGRHVEQLLLAVGALNNALPPELACRKLPGCGVMASGCHSVCE